VRLEPAGEGGRAALSGGRSSAVRAGDRGVAPRLGLYPHLSLAPGLPLGHLYASASEVTF